MNNEICSKLLDFNHLYHFSGGRWGTRHSGRPHQLQAVIDASRALLDIGSHESAKGLLRAFSSDLANGWPGDGRGLAKTRPDAGQNPSEVVE